MYNRKFNYNTIHPKWFLKTLDFFSISNEMIFKMEKKERQNQLVIYLATKQEYKSVLRWRKTSIYTHKYDDMKCTQ